MNNVWNPAAPQRPSQLAPPSNVSTELTQQDEPPDPGPRQQDKSSGSRVLPDDPPPSPLVPRSPPTLAPPQGPHEVEEVEPLEEHDSPRRSSC